MHTGQMREPNLKPWRCEAKLWQKVNKKGKAVDIVEPAVNVFMKGVSRQCYNVRHSRLSSPVHLLHFLALLQERGKREDAEGFTVSSGNTSSWQHIMLLDITLPSLVCYVMAMWTWFYFGLMIIFLDQSAYWRSSSPWDGLLKTENMSFQTHTAF